jgi:hypothetical protein
MTVFDIFCVALLALFIAGFLWVKISKKIAPPQD